MARKPASSARKTASGRSASSRTIRQLVARTNTIADKVAALLGELRRLERQGFVITTLASGKSKNPSP